MYKQAIKSGTVLRDYDEDCEFRKVARLFEFAYTYPHKLDMQMIQYQGERAVNLVTA